MRCSRVWAWCFMPRWRQMAAGDECLKGIAQ
ncbi:hypothetical protein L682_29485 [Aquipseudomonas alcaligenes OT 69]|nr:hypothetical protein L682_29485 [Pseudomonas alcaligenes OT 69]